MSSNQSGLDKTEELQTGASVEQPPQSDSEAASPVTVNDAPPAAASAQPDSPAATAEAEAIAADAEAAADAGGETAAAEAPAAVEEAAPTGGSHLKRGDLVEGVIKSTSPTQILVDVGVPNDGVILADELERLNKRTLESLRVGEKINVYVVNPQGREGHVILSLNRAAEELDWQRAEEFRQSQEVYETRIAGYNKGGLIVRFGRLRGFVPQSQMSADRRRALGDQTPEERWSQMVNEPILVKVMEVDRGRNRLILSERSASRESREKRKENLIGQLNVGEVRTGRVVSLEDFGAFVDVGGAEGLVHLTELSWQHVTHPRELLQVGQEVRVEVISIDKDNKRIGLSMKRQESDPWDTVATRYEVGQLVQGTVTKLTKFGAFAQLVDVPEIEGLIHISELSDKRVNHPREVVNEGDKLTLRVVKIDVKNRRLGLSLKRVNSAEYLDQDWATSFGEGEDPEA
ncbi:MAG: S1 RNA-binding domain-containing protein [Anaerolinea sp.]|nr:S1 RNA-binding domain-containing protein [Anaerolinea sp.]